MRKLLLGPDVNGKRRREVIWRMKHPMATLEMLGFIPEMLDERDCRSAKEQLDENYQHGWTPFAGFSMLPNGDLSYRGDPPTRLLVEAQFREETIRFYEHSWVLVLQKNGTWEVSRMD